MKMKIKKKEKKDEEDIISYAESIKVKITKKIIRDLLKLHSKTNILRAVELLEGREKTLRHTLRAF